MPVYCFYFVVHILPVCAAVDIGRYRIMRKILSRVRRAVEDYKMIEKGDRIAVGLSGGKDSLSALSVMKRLREFYPNEFSLCAVTIDLGLGADFSPLKDYCESLGIEYSIKKTDIGQILFEHRKEPNPCSLCAKMRRGSLGEAAKELGCNKVALGHHGDDAIETFFLSMFYEGRLHCFSPTTYLSRTDLTQIRPLIYVSENEIRRFVGCAGLPVVENTCPANGNTRRQYIKDLIKKLDEENPGLKARMYGAIQRGRIGGFSDENVFTMPKLF